MIESHKRPAKWKRKIVLKECIKTTHVYNHLQAYACTHTSGNNLEGIPNYRQMYSLILLPHFIIGGCDLHWNVFFFLCVCAVVLIVYPWLIKARLSLTMITALRRWRQRWQTPTEGGQGTKENDRGRRREGGRERRIHASFLSHASGLGEGNVCLLVCLSTTLVCTASQQL